MCKEKMASALYILDSKGSPLIYRSYRGDLAQDVSEVFRRRVLSEEEFNIKPVFEEEGCTYTFIRENDVYLLMVSRINTCSLQQIAFLHRCVTVFRAYFKKVTEESVQDNFVIIYELLDEMCDFGYPQYTEQDVLKEYITQQSFISSLITSDTLAAHKLPELVTDSAITWRMPNKYHYRKNEVFLDVVEKVNVLIGQDGELLSSEILGTLTMAVRLSGMPTLRVGLNDKVLYDPHSHTGNVVVMDDVKFHQCVRLNEFESERIISFIPPDGTFDLLTYRCNNLGTAPVQLSCNVVRHGSSRVELFVWGKTTYRRSLVASSVRIVLPIPSDADTPVARCSYGYTMYTPEANALVWTMNSMGGKKDFSCRAQYHLPSVRTNEASALAKRPVEVEFSIPQLAVSGLRIRFVKVTERSNYSAVPWVRYVTRNGVYQVRTN